MAPEKNRSRWLPLAVMLIAFAAPATVGFIEIRVARNAQAETAAIDQLEAIAKAETQYRQAHATYSPKMEDLPGLPKREPYYQIAYSAAGPDAYTATAAPTQPGKHGRRFFYVDQTGVVRYELMRPAGPQSAEVPPIQTPQKAGN